jgi:hypothetical protein
VGPKMGEQTVGEVQKLKKNKTKQNKTKTVS